MQYKVVYNTDNNTIEVPSERQLEYLPVWGSGFNNAWNLHLDRETGSAKIIRNSKILTKIALCIGLPALAFGVAGLVAYFFCYRDKPTWESGLFVGTAVFIGIFFSIFFPLMSKYITWHDKMKWPSCRFFYSSDGTITVAERIVYKPKDRSEIAFGVVTGGESHDRQSHLATQFYFLVLTQDKVWRRHLLAVEAMGMDGRIWRTAEKLSEIMHCKLLRYKIPVSECNKIRSGFRDDDFKAISLEIHRYVGVFPESKT